MLKSKKIKLKPEHSDSLITVEIHPHQTESHLIESIKDLIFLHYCDLGIDGMFSKDSYRWDIIQFL